MQVSNYNHKHLSHCYLQDSHWNDHNSRKWWSTLDIMLISPVKASKILGKGSLCERWDWCNRLQYCQWIVTHTPLTWHEVWTAEERENLRVVQAEAAVEKLDSAEKAIAAICGDTRINMDNIYEHMITWPMDIILIFGDQPSTSPAVQGAVLNLLSTMDFGNTSVTRMGTLVACDPNHCFYVLK